MQYRKYVLKNNWKKLKKNYGSLPSLSDILEDLDYIAQMLGLKVHIYRFSIFYSICIIIIYLSIIIWKNHIISTIICYSKTYETSLNSLPIYATEINLWYAFSEGKFNITSFKKIRLLECKICTWQLSCTFLIPYNLNFFQEQYLLNWTFLSVC